MGSGKESGECLENMLQVTRTNVGRLLFNLGLFNDKIKLGICSDCVVADGFGEEEDRIPGEHVTGHPNQLGKTSF